MSQKGSQFERDMCRKLSLWISAGVRDDLFWRSSNSGGRAKVRSKTGKITHGQYGDICAMHPQAVPFLEYTTVELKRGYPKSTFADILDTSGKAQQWEKFVDQATGDSTLAGCCNWLLITRRNQRVAVIFMPLATFLDLKERGSFHKMPVPFVRLSFRSAQSNRLTKIVGMTLESFLENVSPAVFVKR